MRAWAWILIGTFVAVAACSDDGSDDGTGGAGGSAGSTGGSGGSAGQGCGGAGASDCYNPCTMSLYGPTCVDGGWACLGPTECDGGSD